jgi:hypothetical protein
MSQLAQALIAKEKEERTGYLNLGNCGLTALPEEMFDCVWLETLAVSNEYLDKEQKNYIKSQNKGAENKLSSISVRIKDLQKLKKLVIAGELFNEWKISDIRFLKDLKQLQNLYLRLRCTPIFKIKQKKHYIRRWCFCLVVIIKMRKLIK